MRGKYSPLGSTSCSLGGEGSGGSSSNSIYICVCVYIYIYIYIYVCVYIYIYIYIVGAIQHAISLLLSFFILLLFFMLDIGVAFILVFQIFVDDVLTHLGVPGFSCGKARR